MSLRALGFALSIVPLMVTAASCSSSVTPAEPGPSPASTQPSATTLFSKAVTSVTVEIDYAPGAEPYVGVLKDFGDPWNLFNANALAIFDGKKTVSFPRTLAKMEKLDDVAPKNFSNADVLAIAAAHRTEPQYSDGVSFYVVFLPGYWLDDSGAEQKSTLGVSIGDTGVVALFKPAISAPAENPSAPPQLIEQLALIHFFAHAAGFVDNGIPVGDSNKAHVDTENAHHCTNTQCALSFPIESAKGASTYARKFIRGGQAVLIGQECLSDARLFENAARP